MADFGYSSDVDRALDELSGAGFIRVAANSFGVDVNRGFEILRYDYSLTDSGKRLIDEIGEFQGKSEVRTLETDLKKLGDPDYLDLSIAAKVLFIKDGNQSTLTESEIKKIARDLGWNLNKADIDKAPQILNALGFV